MWMWARLRECTFPFVCRLCVHRVLFLISSNSQRRKINKNTVIVSQTIFPWPWWMSQHQAFAVQSCQTVSLDRAAKMWDRHWYYEFRKGYDVLQYTALVKKRDVRHNNPIRANSQETITSVVRDCTMKCPFATQESSYSIFTQHGHEKVSLISINCHLNLTGSTWTPEHLKVSIWYQTLLVNLIYWMY